nr:MAG: replicase protein [Cressdnaviricota sp.]
MCKLQIERDNISQVSLYLHTSRERLLKMPRRFQVRARNLIITFPQVPEHLQHEFDAGTPFLERVTANFGNPLCCRLGRERHSDGGIHYHIYLGFDKIVTVNSATAFDYFGAHGNIKSIRRTPHKVFDYVGKDGDIRLEHGEPPADARSCDGDNSNKWADIISCDTKESFLSAVRQQAPRDWLLSNQRIIEYANFYYPDEKPEYEAPPITVERERYPEISEWENQAAIGDCRPER